MVYHIAGEEGIALGQLQAGTCVSWGMAGGSLNGQNRVYLVTVIYDVYQPCFKNWKDTVLECTAIQFRRLMIKVSWIPSFHLVTAKEVPGIWKCRNPTSIL